MHAVAGRTSKLCGVTEDSPAPPPVPKIDTTVPHSARIWNYWLGGKDNYPVDREAGDRYREIYPQIVDTARAGRYFLARTVRYLAGEAGIRQFLDVGTGLPTVDNTHDVAQRVAPESRIVYVDNDPLVLAHARALLTSSPGGACDYIDADMRDPKAIRTAAAQTLDLTQPVALLLMGVMGHVSDYDEAHGIVRGLLGSLPAGSYLALADSISSGQAHREAGKKTPRRERSRTSSAPLSRSRVSSPGSRWSTPAWCPSRTGAPTPARSRRPASRPWAESGGRTYRAALASYGACAAGEAADARGLSPQAARAKIADRRARPGVLFDPLSSKPRSTHRPGCRAHRKNKLLTSH